MAAGQVGRLIGASNAQFKLPSGNMIGMLWGYAITGIVGIVGTSLGVWLTGRSQTALLQLNINAENQRARRAEQRLLYFSFLSTYQKFLSIATSSLNLREDPGHALYDEAFTALTEVAEQIAITASNEIYDSAVGLGRMLDQYSHVLWNDRNAPIPSELTDARLKLLNAMRTDLRRGS